MTQEIQTAQPMALESAQGAIANIQTVLSVASAMKQIRESITPAMMQDVMSLMNTPLGFMTDRDPAKARDGQRVTLYNQETVKEVAIEAALRGVQMVGNQFNIIAGRCYITKEGFQHLLKKLKGLSDLKMIIGVPKTSGGNEIENAKGAIVECEASWSFNGKPDGLKCQIPVKLNAYMGVDGAIGKAQRKLCKRIYEQITGCTVNDGEASEEAQQVQIAGPSAKLFESQQKEEPKLTEKQELLAEGIKENQIPFSAIQTWVKNLYGKEVDDIYQINDEQCAELLKPATFKKIIQQKGGELL